LDELEAEQYIEEFIEDDSREELNALVAAIKETLENPFTLRENGRVISGLDRVHGYQAARLW
jgi:hypothetical protein